MDAIIRRLAVGGATLLAAAALTGAAAQAASLDFTPGTVVGQSASGQAGAHADFHTGFRITTDDQDNPTSTPKDITSDLPLGLIGDPTVTPTCTPAQVLSPFGDGGITPCPNTDAVGVATFQLNLGHGFGFYGPYTSLIYNVPATPGSPATFEFLAGLVPVRLETSVEPGGNYNIRATISNVSEAYPLISSDVTLWGVPADHQGPGDLQTMFLQSYGAPLAGAVRKPFMTNPSVCDGQPLQTSYSALPWSRTDSPAPTTAGISAGMTGCDRQVFAPTLAAQSVSKRAGTPSGYQFDVAVPQSDDPDGLATPPLKDASVTLPAGTAISPSSADGLAACTDAQLAPRSNTLEDCPPASKIGTATIDTPLLTTPLTGTIYLGQQLSQDPTSGNMYRIFLAAYGDGVRIKLIGHITADPATGQLTATFANNPQLPFSKLHLEFKDGTRAPLATPKACGTYATHSAFTSWGGKTVTGDSPMTIDQGCDAAGKFGPVLDAGVASPVAGDSSSFVLNLARPDGQQDVSGLNVSLPPGVLARVGSVPLCPEAQATAGTCPAASQVGRTTILAGAGANALSVPQAGKAPTAVYLAGPYKGAPYSLSIVVPAQAGPYDLGTVVVRAALFIDPVDAHVTVASDPLPTIVGGIPLDVQRINVTMDRPGFMVSPTNCDPLQVAAQVTSAQGTAADVASGFQVSDCASLDLKPKLSLSLTGKGQTTDDKHPALSAELSMPAGNANLKKMVVTLPLSLALDPDNSQSDSMCTFVAGQKKIPECPASSIVGNVTATTPLLSTPLSGPVYFIKNERTDAKTGRQIKTYPTLAAVLQGSGITLVLRASTNVPDNAHLVTTFENIPDAPVSDFKLNVNGGKKGILVVSGANLCAATQVTQQVATGQNGKVDDENVTMSTPCALGVVTSSHSASALKLTVGGIGAGKLSVSGKGLTKTSRTIASATTATLAPKLSAGVRSSLAHGRNVKVKVTVSFTPKGAKKAKTIHKTLTIHGAKPKK